MRPFPILSFLLLLIIAGSLITGGSGCAQIGMPTGGPKDTLAPIITTSSPASGATNFTGNKITLNFNEYVEVKDVQSNVLVSPVLKTAPQVNYKFRTVTVKLKDTLLANTTYSINFGDAIKDVNEGNPLKDFTYVFSTGNTIDSLTLGGKVVVAENGAVDSTMIVMLYRNADDSAVQKIKPNYIARLKGDGSFKFHNLPADNFKIYALKDGDGDKTYNAKSEMFAFSNQPLSIGANNAPVALYAYAEEKEKPKQPAAKPAEKKLRYAAPSGLQELLGDYTIGFNKPLKKLDKSKVLLTDTNYVPVTNYSITLDSTSTKVIISNAWKESEAYRLILNKDAFSDSADNVIAKSDTIKILAKKVEDYGNVILRFSNIDLTKNPVIQFVQGDEVKESYPIKAKEWNKKLFSPGEYSIRILYDENNNGKWDPGNYALKKQPEKVVALSQKLSVRANWDNESDIKF